MRFSPVKMKGLLKLTADFTQGPYLILNQRPIELEEELHVDKWIRGPRSPPSLSARVHSSPGHAARLITFSWSRAPVSFLFFVFFFPHKFGGGRTLWHHPPALPGLLATREPSGSQPRTSPLVGGVVKSQQRQGSSQGRRGRGSFPSLQDRVCPALHAASALLVCALLDWVAAS